MGAGGQVWWAGVGAGGRVCGQQKLIRRVGVVEALGAMGQGSAFKFNPSVMERTAFWQWACVAVGGVCI